ncbi:hypothetical protein [Thermococcus sp.]|uniref:hypothetical protein n=1 Tax=Thermococcus sp. TaxID=35749 RepID=UPI002602F7DB|nr:hypothetical protein [Thermococcus sp.]
MRTPQKGLFVSKTAVEKFPKDKGVPEDVEYLFWKVKPPVGFLDNFWKSFNVPSRVAVAFKGPSNEVQSHEDKDE